MLSAKHMDPSSLSGTALIKDSVPPSPDSPEYHYLMNPSHKHVDHRQHVHHEEHHIVGGELPPVVHEHDSDSGQGLHNYATSVNGSVPSSPPDPSNKNVNLNLGARAKRQSKPLSQGSPTQNAITAHEYAARKVAMESDRLRAERGARWPSMRCR